MRIRTRVAFLRWVPVCLLFVAGYIADRKATALRVAFLSDRLDALSKRIDSLPVNSPSSGLSPVNSAPVDRVGDSGKIPVRFLGSGRSGSWCYLDVRLPSGEVRRYYEKRDASPERLAALMRRIREDITDSASMQPAIGGP